MDGAVGRLLIGRRHEIWRFVLSLVSARKRAVPVSTITRRGRITLPEEVRAHLRRAPGDRLDFTIDQDGAVRIVVLSRPVRELSPRTNFHGSDRRLRRRLRELAA